MKLLITTQVVDKQHSVLGFFHGWIAKFAAQFDHVHVIALQVGEYDLPENVSVYSLGKERGTGRIGYITAFYRLVWRLRREYDVVFVHMNPEYVVLAGGLWRAMNKRIGFWYVHRSVTPALILAEKLTHQVFTAAKESFRIPSKKVHILGHGIDTMQFLCKDEHTAGRRIISVGRITPIKQLETLIEAAAILQKKQPNAFTVVLVGAPATPSDDAYLAHLQQQVSNLGLDGIVQFLGAVPFACVVKEYCASDLSVNLCPTGGLDKAVLESMSCGLPSMVSNEAFIPLLGPYQDLLLFPHADAEVLSEKIIALFGLDMQHIGRTLQKEIRTHHSVDARVQDIVAALQ